MTWFKVDDKLHSHPKVARLADDSAALALWVVAGSWSADQLTDGWVPQYVARRLDTEWQHRAAALVRVGLWDAETRDGEPGWVFHGWNEEGRQPTAEQVTADRKANAERQARWRERANEKKSNAVSNGVTNGSVTPTRPDPTRPPTEINTPSADADEPGPDPTPTPPKPGAKPGRQPDEAFARFWRAYPRRTGKIAAEKAWRKATAASGAVSADEIIAAAAFYALERKLQDPKYTKNPATWLNAGCWQDEPDPAYTPPATGTQPTYDIDEHLRGFHARQAELRASTPTTTNPDRIPLPWEIS